MRRRPWPLVILAACHFFAPALNVAISAWLSKLGPLTYLSHMRLGWLGMAEFWLFLPLAGLAIFAMKRWSWVAFLGLTGWVAVSNYLEWQRYPGIFPLWLLGAIYSANALTVSYFMLPAVRRVYFDSRMRWWEAKPRYRVDEPVTIRHGSEARLGLVGRVSDLSEGGALLCMPSTSSDPGTVPLALEFSAASRPVRVTCDIVHARRSGDSTFYGVRFRQDRAQLRAMREITKELDRMRVARRPGYESGWDDFTAWLRVALSTGKGLVPSVPGAPAAQAPAPAPVEPAASADEAAYRKDDARVA